ncbi:hypothetical protein HCU66_17650 [Pseudomonas frederiksbergensis]|uniref:hypothetical protein n=1 Tax=Pseudomonas frederiksbergensis TaxID=104087 RepID=UPI00197DECE9|nr:hypothetical protein [Pseudomonas frederiksbergensis]MBN3864065.1 hypothetical protein [Pseudomonas frederiksbergensis]
MIPGDNNPTATPIIKLSGPIKKCAGLLVGLLLAGCSQRGIPGLIRIFLRYLHL